MATRDTLNLPVDATSAAALADSGLEYTLVDGSGEAFPAYLQAVSRGFLGQEPSAEETEVAREALRVRRLIGVYDPSGTRPDVPVATVDSWPSDLTVSPGRTAPVWSISAVTVSPTHRRRGIARAMLTGELRTAAAAGYAIAGLTVTEATIYGRWGFSPAAWASDVEIDTARARWIGPAPSGRLDFIDRAAVPDLLDAIHERVRPSRPGAVRGWPTRWRGLAGLLPDEKEATKVRAVAYRDADGLDRGVLVYTLHEQGNDYTSHELRIRMLLGDGDDAIAALWRFALEHDLVAKVTASLQPSAPPVQWMIADRRAVRTTVTDHHWLRILDVPAALAARAYAAPLDVVMRVDDPLGFADGVWSVRVDADGAAVVVPADGFPVDVELTVGGLASILLGGVRATELAAAGIVEGAPDRLAAVDRAFAPATTPLLDIWY